MAGDNLGVCSKCRAFVPVEHVKRDGKVYLRKHCPDCGPTEVLVSTDVENWQQKRDTWRYEDSDHSYCSLNCTECSFDHEPAMVFVDVTNRCNMNCPICIANIPAMGFKFEPPMSYFETLFEGLKSLAPNARINLFGGEPTVRDDLFEIISLARSHGFRPRIVTNGLRLEKMEYAKKIADAQVPLLLSLDGMHEDIYERLRRNPGAFHRKMKGLENLKKLNVRKNTIMTCVARNINEHEMWPVIQFCHENRHMIRAMHLIPLTETWEEGEFETDVHTTSGDVENIIDAAVPEGRVEFWPAGLPARWTGALKSLGAPKLTFGGVHPNCESATILLSDGEQYRGLGYYVNGSLNEMAAELTDFALTTEPRMAHLAPRSPLAVAWSLLMVLGGVAPKLIRFLNWKRILKGNRALAVLKILAGLATGKKPKDVLRANTNVQDALRMIVLPFEEYHSVETERLCRCKAVFGYVDPTSERVQVVPVCAWSLYKDDIQRETARKYGTLVTDIKVAAAKTS